MQTKLNKEECAEGMEQRPHDASSKDAQNILRGEEFALSMVQCVNYVVLMDVQTKPY